MTSVEDTDPRLKMVVGRVRRIVSELEDKNGADSRIGDRASILIQPEGVTIFDTGGIEAFSMPVPTAEESERVRAAQLVWESFHCTECGIRIKRGAIYCRECVPYGFGHWMKYFSAFRWILGGGFYVDSDQTERRVGLDARLLAERDKMSADTEEMTVIKIKKTEGEGGP